MFGDDIALQAEADVGFTYYERPLKRIDSSRGIANFVTAEVSEFSDGAEQDIWEAVGLPWVIGNGETIQHEVDAPSGTLVVLTWQPLVITAETRSGCIDALASLTIEVDSQTTRQIVTITNSSDDVINITGVSARGNYLTVQAGGKVINIDQDSIDLYEKRPYNYENPFNNDIAQARRFTKAAIADFAEPPSLLELTYTVVTQDDVKVAALLDISDRIAVKSSEDGGLGVSSHFFVEHIKMNWNQRTFKVTYLVSAPRCIRSTSSGWSE